MIIMIDDEYTWIKGYLDAFRLSGLDYEHFEDVDSAWEHLNSITLTKDDIIVLDIMLPPGERYGFEDTNDGRIVGELLYIDIRVKFPNAKIIVLTNKNKEENMDKFTGDNTFFCVKEDTDSIELIDIINNLMSKE